MMEAMPFFGYWSQGGIECEHHLEVVLRRRRGLIKQQEPKGDEASEGGDD
jgi:hypothetical protein